MSEIEDGLASDLFQSRVEVHRLAGANKQLSEMLEKAFAEIEKQTGDLEASGKSAPGFADWLASKKTEG
jgi:hypothetical protein